LTPHPGPPLRGEGARRMRAIERCHAPCRRRFASPSPLNGERAGVRGEKFATATLAKHVRSPGRFSAAPNRRNRQGLKARQMIAQGEQSETSSALSNEPKKN